MYSHYLYPSFIIYSSNGGVERSSYNVGSAGGGAGCYANFRSNDLLAPCESAHGAVSHLLSFGEKQIGRADPLEPLNSVVSAVRSTALTTEISGGCKPSAGVICYVAVYFFLEFQGFVIQPSNRATFTFKEPSKDILQNILFCLF